MKKWVTRLASLMLCSAISLGFMATASSAEDVIFVALNIELQELSYDTMPFFDGGVLYVAGDIFASSTLGTMIARGRQQLSISKGSEKTLVFSTVDDSVMDQDKNYYSVKPLYRNGRIFVPAEFICIFFGLSYSYITYSDVAPIVRIKSSVAYDDQSFTTAAKSILQNRLKKYLSSFTTSVIPDTTPTVPPVQTANPNTPPPSFDNGDVYLAIYGLDAEVTPKQLTVLDQISAKACFFVTAEDITENQTLVRRIIGQGHGIGLLSEGENAGDDWNNAEAALKRYAVFKTIIAAALIDENAGETAKEMGLLEVFSTDISVLSGTNTIDDSEIGELLSFDDYNVIILGSDSVAADYLDTIVRVIRLGHFNVKLLRETSPVTNADQ